MKKLLLSACIIAFVAIANTSFAQHSMPKIGVKGGVSFTGVSNLSGKDRVTGHGGIYVHHTITKNWCFQPEILYSAQGQHFQNDLGQRKILALDYIQAPFMMQYYPANKFYVELG